MAETMNINEAFVKACSEMDQPKLDAQNPHFHSAYSSLGELLRVIKKPLAAHGLAIVQQLDINQDDEIHPMTLLTKVVDGQGAQLILGAFPITTGAIQTLGSGITYAKRYSLAAAFGLAAGDDDDGEEENKKPAPKRKPARKQEAAPKTSQQATTTNGTITAKQSLWHAIQGYAASQGKDAKEVQSSLEEAAAKPLSEWTDVEMAIKAEELTAATN